MCISPHQSALNTLTEKIIGLIAIIDTPMGRRKLGIDPSEIGANMSIQTETLYEAKKALATFEQQGLLDPEIVKQYSHYWK